MTSQEIREVMEAEWELYSEFLEWRKENGLDYLFPVADLGMVYPRNFMYWQGIEELDSSGKSLGQTSLYDGG